VSGVGVPAVLYSRNHGEKTRVRVRVVAVDLTSDFVCRGAQNSILEGECLLGEEGSAATGWKTFAQGGILGSLKKSRSSEKQSPYTGLRRGLRSPKKKSVREAFVFTFYGTAEVQTYLGFSKSVSRDAANS